MSSIENGILSAGLLGLAYAIFNALSDFYQYFLTQLPF